MREINFVMIQPIHFNNSSVNFGRKRVMGKEDVRIIPSSNQSDLEKSIEEKIQIPPTPTMVKKFANGETYEYK